VLKYDKVSYQGETEDHMRRHYKLKNKKLASGGVSVTFDQNGMISELLTTSNFLIN
jgi:hypothetical protein